MTCAFPQNQYFLSRKCLFQILIGEGHPGLCIRHILVPSVHPAGADWEILGACTCLQTAGAGTSGGRGAGINKVREFLFWEGKFEWTLLGKLLSQQIIMKKDLLGIRSIKPKPLKCKRFF